MSDDGHPLFRGEAIRHAARARAEGDVLRILPTWTGWTYWVILAAFLTGLLYAFLGTVHEYGSGPSVVWVAGRSEVTATVASIVSRVDVVAGQRVEAGAALVRLHAAREAAELERLQREFDLQLARALRNPADGAARQALTALRAERELAAARVEQLTIRAPTAGVVGDVRIRPGQSLGGGDILLTLTAEPVDHVILAMLPAQYRPQLKPGMSLRFEVTGYRYAYQEMILESVGAQIIGPAEVRKKLNLTKRAPLALAA